MSGRGMTQYITVSRREQDRRGASRPPAREPHRSHRCSSTTSRTMENTHAAPPASQSPTTRWAVGLVTRWCSNAAAEVDMPCKTASHVSPARSPYRQGRHLHELPPSERKQPGSTRGFGERRTRSTRRGAVLLLSVCVMPVDAPAVAEGRSCVSDEIVQSRYLWQCCAEDLQRMLTTRCSSGSTVCEAREPVSGRACQTLSWTTSRPIQCKSTKSCAFSPARHLRHPRPRRPHHGAPGRNGGCIDMCGEERRNESRARGGSSPCDRLPRCSGRQA